MSRSLRPSAECLNCGAAVSTRFCPECGQENTTYRVSLGRLLGDLFEELFQLESRLWRTLWTLFRRPGLLTREYNAGRRVRYTTPLRLYLVASVAYFFVGSLVPASTKGEAGRELNIQVAELSPAQRAEMAKAPRVVRWLYERASEAKHDGGAAVARMRRTLAEWAPRIAAGLVPLLALLTWLMFRRPKLYYVEHLVFALHLHAMGFLLLLVGEVVRWEPVNIAVTLVFVALIYLSARALFAQSRARTIFKLLAAGIVYSIFLGLGIGAAAAFGFLSRG